MNNFYSQEKVFFQKAKKNIEKYTNIVILGHINPDGDCIGSQTALYYAIKAKYPNKKIYFPFAETEYSKFLLPQNYQNEINPTIFKNSLVIVVDFHEKKRLNNLKIPKDNFVIVIDHHPEISRDLGDLVWIDKSSMACCEMIYFFLKALQFPINSDVATALMLGIITDSGNFTHTNTKTTTFIAAAELMQTGVNLQTIHKNLNSQPLINLKLHSYYLQNFVKKENLIYFTFCPNDIKKIPLITTIKEPFSSTKNIPKNLKNINVWANFIQINKQEAIKCSLRSIEEIDVSVIARKYGGGGHKNAAGITLKNWKTIDKVIKDLKFISKII